MAGDFQLRTWQEDPVAVGGTQNNGFHLSPSSSSNNVAKQHGALSPFDYTPSDSLVEPFFALKAGPVSCFCDYSEESPMQVVVKQKTPERNASSKSLLVVGSPKSEATNLTWDGHESGYDVAWPVALGVGSSLHEERVRNAAGYRGELRKSPCKSSQDEAVKRNLSTKFTKGDMYAPTYAILGKRQSPSMTMRPWHDRLSSEQLSPRLDRQGQLAPIPETLNDLSEHLPTTWSDQCSGDRHPLASELRLTHNGIVAKRSPAMETLTEQVPASWGDG